MQEGPKVSKEKFLEDLKDVVSSLLSEDFNDKFLKNENLKSKLLNKMNSVVLSLDDFSEEDREWLESEYKEFYSKNVLAKIGDEWYSKIIKR